MACAIAAGALLGSGFVAERSSAQTVGELESQIAAARERAGALGAEIEARSGELAGVAIRARAAAEREAQLAGLLAEGRERAAALREDVAVAEDELAATKQRLRRARSILADRLVAIYRSDDPDSLDVLLRADGFDDLATRTELLERIRDADSRLIERVNRLRERAADELARLRAAEAEVQALNERTAAAREQIAAVRRSAEAEAAALVAARERQQAALAELQGQVGEWTAQVQRLEQISAAQARERVAEWLGPWAIPRSIVICESGGNFSALNPDSGAGGAYQILPSTWRLYGGTGRPDQASPAEQHRIASLIWRDSGGAAWECAG